MPETSVDQLEHIRVSLNSPYAQMWHIWRAPAFSKEFRGLIQSSAQVLSKSSASFSNSDVKAVFKQ